jgi:hypothetical protein
LVAGGRPDDGIAARLVTQTRGNPLALIELRGEPTEGLRKQAGSSRPIACLPSEAQWLANSSLRGARGAA